MKEEQLLIETLKLASAAHHEYETVTLKGKRDEQALGWYAGYVIGRLGDFAKPSELTSWLEETRVRDKYEIAAKNVIQHIADAGSNVSFAKPQKLSADRTTAEKQLLDTLKAAASAHHQYEEVTLKGQLDTQALGWYAGFTAGRLGEFAKPSNLTSWLEETRVRNKEEIAAKNVVKHVEAARPKAAAKPMKRPMAPR